MLAPSDQITSKKDCCKDWLLDAGTAENITRTLIVKDEAAYNALEAETHYLPAIWKKGSCTVKTNE